MEIRENIKTGFIYKKLGCDLTHVRWFDNEALCKFNSGHCGFRERDEKCCQKNIIAHCCKHVVNGVTSEKERFVEYCERKNVEVDICDEMKEELLKSYEEISLGVLTSGNIYVTKVDDEIRFMDAGKGEFNGIVDVIVFDSAREGNKLGIISSYFNFANADCYIMYRLAHQRYNENKEWGTNIDLALGVEKDMYTRDWEFRVPDVDAAFALARTCYTDDEVVNQSAGVIYEYFDIKYKRLIDKFYQDISKKLSVSIINKDKFICYRRKKYPKKLVNFEKWLNNIIRIDESVYEKKSVSDYLRLISEEEFNPEKISRFRTHEKKGLIDYLDVKRRGRITTLKCEMIIQKSYLNRKKEVYSIYSKNEGLEKLLKTISPQDTNELNAGSIIDLTAYNIVNSLLEYFIALYVFSNNCIECYSNESKYYADIECILKREINKFEEKYNEFVILSKDYYVLDEWIEIFNGLYDFENRVKELFGGNYRKG